MPQTERLSALTRQISRLARRIGALDHRSRRLSWLRLSLFVIGLAATFGSFFMVGPWTAGVLMLLSTSLFIVVVLVHRRVDASRECHERLCQHLLAQVARAGRDWAHIPPPRQREPRFDHPFEADLDLVGERSLHRLLDTAVTAQGGARLRAWLTETNPDTAETGRRQQLVRELTPLVLLRHRLVVDGQAASGETTGWEPTRLLSWLGQRAEQPRLRFWVIVLSVLAVVNGLLFLADQLNWLSPLWRYSLPLYIVLYFLNGRVVNEVFHTAADLRDEVERLLVVFRRLEQFGYARTPHLRVLCAPFTDPTHKPSHYLQRLALVTAATGIQGNPLIALVLNTVLPWGLIFADALQRLQATLSVYAPTWLDAWADLEALSALANYAYLNPAATFPKFHNGDAAPIFAVSGLGHPLLADAHKVRNDFTFTALGGVVILTGSNMAGKSTLLKALGVNLALAYAGGVVDATQLETAFFRLFTCIKVSDSVTNGISYFYAEVQRLKALLDALETPHPLPLFYCIDEIFRGTNNRERLLGSRAYIGALVHGRGVGLIATHDLELVTLADTEPAITNYHFRDEIVNGKMSFDYRLRPGPSPTTNALKIMRSAGLPVAGREFASEKSP